MEMDILDQVNLPEPNFDANGLQLIFEVCPLGLPQS
jgi:hypothetical protein